MTRYTSATLVPLLTSAVSAAAMQAWTGWWLAVAVAVVAVGRDFTDSGHALALALGTLVSMRFGRPAAWTPMRYLLLVVASAFGFLMLANAGLSLIVATGLGVVGALIAEVVAARRWPRRSTPRPVGAECALSPGIA